MIFVRTDDQEWHQKRLTIFLTGWMIESGAKKSSIVFGTTPSHLFCQWESSSGFGASEQENLLLLCLWMLL